MVLMLCCLFIARQGSAQRYNTVEHIVIPASENEVVRVTADLYKPLTSPEGAFLMFHQAGSSRGEFTEVAQRLNRLNYLCLAVDLRSGKAINEVENETHKEAKAKMKGTSYLDAYTDMLSSLLYLQGLLKSSYKSDSLAIYVMGSSYSAALSCRLAAEQGGKMLDGIFVFSPGEYFGNLNGDETYVGDFLKQVSIPIWATSSQSEMKVLEQLLTNVPDTTNLTQYKPITSGQHGAKALWPQFTDSEDYWESMLSFLNSLN